MFKFAKSKSKLGNEKGVSAVEFALVLPIFLMLVIGIFQFGIAFNNWIAITHAAREGARLAAVGQYDEQRVRDSAPSVAIQSISVSGLGGSVGSPVTVIVTGNVLNINIPFAGNWPVTLRSTAVMRLEQ
ncbi:MAG: pilus assembly protein [Actinomycetia bacterium]|nr:pilus assembly protein [Actinomycetota bacterium]MCG2788566.1 pilus assembly protein [Actinomycetes bacterium]